MNAIVSNKNKGLLDNLDVERIKTINGEFTASEIANIFSNIFFNRMFLDVTAIKKYQDVANIQKLSSGIEMDKIILLLDNNLMNDSSYISKLISIGIYNFGNDRNSLLYLYNHPNSYKDVAHLHRIEDGQYETNKKVNYEYDASSRSAKVIGFKNLTIGAGATTLIYMLKRIISQKDYVVAIEVNKNDFGFFNEKDMYSVNQNNLLAAINKFGNANLILVDLNNAPITSCDDIIYLLEPSMIKLNKLMLVNKNIFEKIDGKTLVLSKSLLSAKDVSDFEYETRTKVAYNLPPLNDRIENTYELEDFIRVIGL